jgi:Arc/MetJ family transcription regulator
VALSTAQQAQYDRFSDARKAELSESRMERFTTDQIKARVNITGIGDVVTWSSECNYTETQKQYVEAAMPRAKWAIEVPLILAEAAALEADGTSVTLIKSILKSR